MKLHTLFSVAGFSLALAVALGAFGAHALENILTPERLDTWKTAVFYHSWNALGLIVIGLVSRTFLLNLNTSTWLILAGISIFSGSLYTLCLTDLSFFGAITPIGGVCLISGWIVFAWKCVKLPTGN